MSEFGPIAFQVHDCSAALKGHASQGLPHSVVRPPRLLVVPPLRKLSGGETGDAPAEPLEQHPEAAPVAAPALACLALPEDGQEVESRLSRAPWEWAERPRPRSGELRDVTGMPLPSRLLPRPPGGGRAGPGFQTARH
eukprot:15276723-Alexandrium_andersonii.AAC.1